MGKRFADRMKKSLAQTLIAGLLLVPAVLPPAEPVEGKLPGEVTAESGQPENGNGGEDGVMPCGDWIEPNLERDNQ